MSRTQATPGQYWSPVSRPWSWHHGQNMHTSQGSPSVSSEDSIDGCGTHHMLQVLEGGPPSESWPVRSRRDMAACWPPLTAWLAFALGPEAGLLPFRPSAGASAAASSLWLSAEAASSSSAGTSRVGDGDRRVRAIGWGGPGRGRNPIIKTGLEPHLQHFQLLDRNLSNRKLAKGPQYGSRLASTCLKTPNFHSPS